MVFLFSSQNSTSSKFTWKLSPLVIYTCIYCLCSDSELRYGSGGQYMQYKLTEESDLF